MPDGSQRRPRGPRQNETSKAQAFYNLKTSWQELELWIAANFTEKDMVITFTFDDDHLPDSKSKAGDLFVQTFARKLRTARAKRGDDLKFIIAPEGFHEKRGGEFLDEDGELETEGYTSMRWSTARPSMTLRKCTACGSLVDTSEPRSWICITSASWRST